MEQGLLINKDEIVHSIFALIVLNSTLTFPLKPVVLPLEEFAITHCKLERNARRIHKDNTDKNDRVGVRNSSFSSFVVCLRKETPHIWYTFSIQYALQKITFIVEAIK